ncbi:acyltransferase family protein [Celeribacter halophilus]|uniref:acyltransferase family protein n=1 Tax=Celeribacter halophilus TaxID=576117 RepID=UPI001C07F7C0|nr:acyltransferase [Celeribacter halophilus]MBU2888292.1 acyltransferase [Celeribacter halophilus]MDO6512033.1 acyltransferase [Celeribacter halophilus]
MTKSGEIVSLTGLRGFAAVFVVLYHANQSAIAHIDGHYDDMIFHGRLFVDVFFVLSGFVMSYVYLRSPPEIRKFKWKRFFLARFARVYPLHIATALASFAGILALQYVSEQPPKELTFHEFLREITLTQAMPVIGNDQIWNSPSWSVSVEFWTYVFVFPTLIILQRIFSVRQTTVILYILLPLLILYLYSLDENIDRARGLPAFLRAVVGFYAGWVIWRLCVKYEHVRFSGLWVVIQAVLILYVTQMFSGQHTDPWFILLLFPTFIFSVVVSRSAVTRLMETRLIYFLGVISYSLYLTHPLILKVIQLFSQRIEGLQGNVPLTLAAALIIGIPIASFSYYFFEVPARNYLKKIGNKKTSETISSRRTQ